MKVVKAFVIVMGIMLVVGFVALILKANSMNGGKSAGSGEEGRAALSLSNGASREAAGSPMVAATSGIVLPKGGQIDSMVSTGKGVALLIKGPGVGGSLYFMDAKGRLLSHHQITSYTSEGLVEPSEQIPPGIGTGTP